MKKEIADYLEFRSIFEECLGIRLHGYIKAVKERGINCWWCKCYESTD